MARVEGPYEAESADMSSSSQVGFLLQPKWRVARYYGAPPALRQSQLRGERHSGSSRPDTKKGGPSRKGRPALRIGAGWLHVQHVHVDAGDVGESAAVVLYPVGEGVRPG